MPNVNPIAIAAATAAVFVISSTYYAVLSQQWADVSGAATHGRPEPRKVALELVRSLILTTVIAGLAARGEITDLSGGLLLGLALWVGLPFVLWTGAMLWENTPLKLAALHAGDWFVKLLVIAVIVSIWQ
ncbi:MAG: DUF1761 domain-containing protein [Solirubrobacteraceae bacterium]